MIDADILINTMAKLACISMQPDSSQLTLTPPRRSVMMAVFVS
jgi:hypothetical protein